jgi:asparagine synthase (glutamine-hydrolysing)
MQHSIEARAPFLSHRLVEAMMNLPTEVKNPKSDWYKGLFRQWGSKILPAPVLNAQKRGFAIPRQWRALPVGARNIQSVQRVVDRGFVDRTAESDLRRKENMLWKILQIDHAIARGML